MMDVSLIVPGKPADGIDCVIAEFRLFSSLRTDAHDAPERLINIQCHATFLHSTQIHTHLHSAVGWISLSLKLNTTIYK